VASSSESVAPTVNRRLNGAGLSALCGVLAVASSGCDRREPPVVADPYVVTVGYEGEGGAGLEGLWGAAQTRGAAQCRSHDTLKQVRIEWSGLPEDFDSDLPLEATYSCEWLLQVGPTP
jgi:hypothetical protein